MHLATKIQCLAVIQLSTSGILVDKGIGKIRCLDKAEDLAKARTKIDDVVDIIKAADKVDGVARVGGIEGGLEGRLIPGTEGVVTGGDSTKLGKNMMESMELPRGINWTGYQAQHIISAEMENHPVLQEIGMDLDDAGIDINLSVDVLQKQVYDLQQNLKYLQQSGVPLYPSQGATVDLWQRSLERIQ